MQPGAGGLPFLFTEVHVIQSFFVSLSLFFFLLLFLGIATCLVQAIVYIDRKRKSVSEAEKKIFA